MNWKFDFSPETSAGEGQHCHFGVKFIAETS